MEPEKNVPLYSKHLHFVKFGDEKGTTERVTTYPTHNPTCKLCHTLIAFDPGFDVSHDLVANDRAH